jgi:hypothetical protein
MLLLDVRPDLVRLDFLDVEITDETVMQGVASVAHADERREDCGERDVREPRRGAHAHPLDKMTHNIDTLFKRQYVGHDVTPTRKGLSVITVTTIATRPERPT